MAEAETGVKCILVSWQFVSIYDITNWLWSLLNQVFMSIRTLLNCENCGIEIAKFPQFSQLSSVTQKFNVAVGDKMIWNFKG